MKSTAAKAGRILVVLALLASIGAHWAVLRGVAWTQMLVERTQQGSFSEAVKTTFDGAHPCEMCRKITQEQQKERQDQSQAIQKVKFDVILVTRAISFQAPQALRDFPAETASAIARTEKPAFPPPRRA